MAYARLWVYVDGVREGSILTEERRKQKRTDEPIGTIRLTAAKGDWM